MLNCALEWGRKLSGLDALDYYRAAHREIFEAILAAQNRGDSPEYPITLEILKTRGKLESVTNAYLLEVARDGVLLSDSALASAVKRLKELRVLRDAAAVLARGLRNPYALDIGEVISQLTPLTRRASDSGSIRFQTAKQLACAVDRVDWVLEGYLARGAITELTGKAKISGKTTLAAHWVAALVQGRECLTRRTRRTPVVYLTEQTSSTFREVLRRAGLTECDDLSILSYWDVWQHAWPEIAEMAHAEARRVDAALVVVDTLGQFAGIKGDGENNAGDAQQALAPLQQVAHAGIAVLVTRHARKSGGDVGEDGRGSSQFTGGVDIVLSLKRLVGQPRPTLRSLEALSRFSETPERLIVERISAQTGESENEVWADWYEVRGDDDAVATAEAKGRIEQHLGRDESGALSVDELVSVTSSSRSAVQRALKIIPGVEWVGKGRRNAPRKCFRPPAISAQTSNNEVDIEQKRTVQSL